MTDPQGPKIIVDSDWKSQAQAEKERLAAAEKAKQPAHDPLAGGDTGEPPQASFEELVRSLAMQSLMYLGAFPDPESGRRIVGLEPAKFNIDLLGMLEQKTKGNLTPEEGQFLTEMLHELRMRYVEISGAVAKAVEQGRVQQVPGAAPGPQVPPMNLKPKA